MPIKSDQELLEESQNRVNPTDSTEASSQVSDVQKSSNWIWIFLGAISPLLLGLIGFGIYTAVAPKLVPVNVIVETKPSSPVSTSSPSPTSTPQVAQSSPSPIATPQTSQSSCNYFAGAAVEGQAVNVDLCSVSVKSSGAVSFVYHLGSQRMPSETDCTSGAWTTLPDREVHRPLSVATQKMLEQVCARQRSNAVKLTEETKPAGEPINSNSSAIAFNSSSVNTTSPEDLVRKYYDNIKSGRYEDSWNMLPSGMQKDQSLHPNGYGSFSDWWTKTSADVDTVRLVSQSDRDAVVNVDVRYTVRRSSPSSLHLRYFFTKDPVSNSWTIAKIKLQ